MQQDTNSNNVMESENHFKNETRLRWKNRIKWIDKNILVIITIFLIFSFVQNMKGQISLVYTFPDVNYNFDENINYYVTPFAAGSLRPDHTHSPHSMKLYNSDCSLYKTVTIEPPMWHDAVPLGGSLSVYYLSKTLFNNDNKVEFLAIFYVTTGFYHLLLYNEDGQILYDFGESQSGTLPPTKDNGYGFFPTVFKTQESKYYLSIKKQKSKSTEIYALPGNITSSLEINGVEQKNPYPNPAKTTINLPYKLNQGESATMYIYNTSGKLVEEKKIDYLFDRILLDVSGYKKGTYIYNVNNISNKFIVN